MYVGGSFNNWGLQQMTLQNDEWTKNNIPFSVGNYELKFANTSDWSGNDWGDENGLSGFAKLTTGGGANIKFNIETAGNYNIKFNDMTLYYKIYDASTLSVNDILKKGVQIYPNPAENSFFILSEKDAVKRYEIYDMSGRIIKSENTICTKCDINISGIARGNYILNVYFGNQIVGQKLIIK